MPNKEKAYNDIIFFPEVIRQADSVIVNSLPKGNMNTAQMLSIKLLSGEEWKHDNEDEFFADYRRGFLTASFLKSYYVIVAKIKNFPNYEYYDGSIDLYVNHTITGDSYTEVSISMPTRADLEKVFEVFEANVDKCRLPKEPKSKLDKSEINWINQTVHKIKTYNPNVARRLKLALIKIESDDKEEWQNAAMQIRDAWIELAQWLCEVHNFNTSDITQDSVVDRLKKLGLDKSDDKLFNLARASFQLSMKHHKRDIELDTAVACVISAIVSMKTVIQEVFHAHT